MVAAPSTPLSWCTHAPRRRTGSPLIRRPRFGIERERSDAERRRLLVDDDVIVEQGGVARVEVRIVEAPPLWVADVQPETRGDGVARERGHRRVGTATLAPSASSNSTRSVDCDVAPDSFRTSAATATTAPASSISGVRTCSPSGARCTRPRLEQPHVPVDAGAGVPARVVARARLDPQLVLRAVSEQVVDRHEEVRVAVRTVRGEGAVHGDHRVAVDAFELEQHHRVGVVRA